MAPTAELPVVRCCSGVCQDDDITIKSSSSSPSSCETIRPQAYFPSPYTRGLATATGKYGQRNDSPSSMTSTVRQAARTLVATSSTRRSYGDAQSSRRYRHSQSVGCVLPKIDSNVNKRHQYLSVARDSPSESVSGTSPRDDFGAASTSSPPKKQSRTSINTSSSQERSGVDAGTRLLVGRRETISGRTQKHRRRTAQEIPPSRFDDVTRTYSNANVDDVDFEANASKDWDQTTGRSTSSPDVLVSDSTTPVLRSILALYRCHDCSMENVRTFVDGLELDPVSHRRRHLGRSRCSRLLPSAAASAVLLGLSLSPRSSITELDESAVDRLDGDVTNGTATSFVCQFEYRKCVHFEPIVRVFCDDDDEAEIRQLRPSSGGSSTAQWTAHRTGLLPPLQPSPLSAESTMTLSTRQAEDLPPVVQRYMIRCHGQQHQQQRHESNAFPAGPETIDVNACHEKNDDNRVALPHRLSVVRQ